MKKKRTDEIDKYDNEAELTLLLDNKKRILIIEGESDICFFKILLSECKGDVLPFCIHGEHHRSDIIELFSNFKAIQNNKSVLGLIDKDTEDYDDIVYTYNNLLVTEYADLDCYLINFSGFKSFVAQILDKPNIIRFLGYIPSENILKLRKFIYNSLVPLTRFRKVNIKYKFPLGKVFPKFPPELKKVRYKKIKKILNDKMQNESKNMFDFISAHQECHGKEMESIVSDFDSCVLKDFEFATNGHDIISFITCLNNLSSIHRNDLDIEELLRLTIQLNNYTEYKLTNYIYHWALNIEGEPVKEIASMQ